MPTQPPDYRATNQKMAAELRRYMDSLCQVESTVPMPQLARKIHGRKHYACGLKKHHDGPHRWPGDYTVRKIAEWL